MKAKQKVCYLINKGKEKTRKINGVSNSKVQLFRLSPQFFMIWWHREGIESKIFRIVCWGIASQHSKHNAHNSSSDRIGLVRSSLQTRRLNSAQTFSIGDKSGEYAGNSKISSPRSSRYSVTSWTKCVRRLSCWNSVTRGFVSSIESMAPRSRRIAR